MDYAADGSDMSLLHYWSCDDVKMQKTTSENPKSEKPKNNKRGRRAEWKQESNARTESETSENCN
jgi:hypothetical protein